MLITLFEQVLLAMPKPLPYITRIMQSRWMRRISRMYVGSVLVFAFANVLVPLDIDIPYAQAVYAEDGTLLNAYLARDDRWRFQLVDGDISPELETALLAKEDRYFYWHFGINPVAIGRALINNMTKGRRTSGASTLSMQVVRMLNPKKRTYSNKIWEMFRAMQLEWQYDKQEILQLYLTKAPYGSNIEGIKAASYIFFRKPPAQLSLAEAVTLVVVPNRPNSLALARHNEAAQKARNQWLARFREQKLFSEQAIAYARDEPLDVKRHAMPKLAPHVGLRLARLYSRPILHTTLSSELQQKTAHITQKYIRSIHHKGITNASVLIIDNKTGHVKAYIGSADFKNVYDQGQVDGITAVRSPGSTLKPFCYAWAIDKGIITPQTKIADVPTNVFGYIPENYNLKFHGNVSVEYALAQSLNIPAVRVLQKLGTENFITKMSSSGFSQVSRDKDKLGLSMILGGCGVTLEELTTMYTALANGGRYRPLKFLASERQQKQRVFSRASAYLVSKMMTQLVRPDLPTAFENSSNLPKVAWKTGTSYGRRDAWALGFSDEYTIGVWVGNFNGQGHPDLSGAEVATPLLFELFTTIASGEKLDWLKKPLLLSTRKVCNRTGLPPGQRCTDFITDYYIQGVSPAEKCQCRKPFWVSENGRYSYNAQCLPTEGYVTRVYDNYSAELTAYLKTEGVPINAPPPLHPDCNSVEDNDMSLHISHPVEGAEYILDLKNPRKLALEANYPADANKLYWFINEAFYRRVSPGDKLFFAPDTGQVTITLNDDKGRKHSVSFHVKGY